MHHFDEIKSFISHLYKSDRCHCLIILGPPGWGKSCTVRETLCTLGVDYEILGAYSTPLALFNALCEAPDKTVVLDDTAGLLTNPQALALLAAAIWPGSDSTGARLVKWSSTAERIPVTEVAFKGKVIILTNAIPSSHAADALSSRSLRYEIKIDPEQIPALLLDAVETFPAVASMALAREVAQFLADQAKHCDVVKFNLRTLEQGIDFAIHSPEVWKQMLLAVLPRRKDATLGSSAREKQPADIVVDLDRSALPVHEQVTQFEQLTGQKRRTFFTLRKQLGLSKPRIIAS